MRGFTLIELSVAALLLAVLLGSIAAAIGTDTATHRALVAEVGPQMRAKNALERIASELRMAGVWGEDRDRDGQMSAGEDTNGNGVLDHDWNLADGAEQATLAFNRRIDDWQDGELIASGIYSRRVAYHLEPDGRLIRTWDRTVGGNVQSDETVVARQITSLTFSRDGGLVTVALELDFPGPRPNETVTRRHTQRIWLRN